MSADLIAKVLARRESWVELEPGKRVKIRRPSESEMPSLGRGITPDKVVRHCVGWEGFSEADVLGPDLGSGNTTVPFDQELWATLALDNSEWFSKVTTALIDAVSKHIEARSAAAKN